MARKKTTEKRVSAALKKYLAKLKGNPSMGRKVKGGRRVSLKNFTGTITRTAGGQLVVYGRKGEK